MKRFEKEKCWYDDITGSEPDFRTLYAKITKEEADEEKQRLDTLWGACKSDGERRTFLLGHLDREWGKHRFDLATRALNLKVLDPAMGSGHFLVHVVDVISESIATYLNQHPYSPVSKELETLRGGILQNVQKQDVKINQEKLADVNLIKRMVMKRCVYGVDLNPMAGELAKLSLWLDSFTVGAPLSFLDHHLRCGNSLIGTSISEVRSALEGEKKETHTKLSLLTSQFTGLMRAVELMQEVGELSDATIGEVEESKARYDRAIGELAPFKALLDVWLSEHFRNKGAQEAIKQRATIVETTVKHVLGRSQAFDNNRQVTLGIVTKAFRLAGSKRFFHWELEFPEVWYEGGKRRVNPGFDTVIGNPPWVAIDNLNSDDKEFYTLTYLTAQKFDLAHVFTAVALRVSKMCGYVSMIIPEHSWIGEFHTSFRLLLLTRARISWVGSLKEGDFVDVSNPASFFGSRVKDNRHEPYTFPVLNVRCKDRIQILGEYEAQSQDLEADIVLNTQNQPVCLYRVFFDSRLPSIRAAVHRSPTSYLDNLAVVSDGVKTANALHEIMVHQSRNNPDPRRYVKALRSGESIPCRYGSTVWSGWWILNETEAKEFSPRSGFSYGTPRRVYCFKSDQKIIMRQTEPTIIATLDEAQYRFPNSIFTLALKEHFTISILLLLAVLNSKLIRRYYLLSSQVEGTTKPQLYINQLKSLPIRLIFFTTPESERGGQVTALQGLYQQGDFNQLLKAVAACLPQEDNGEFIVFTSSIPVEQAIEKGFLIKEQVKSWALDPGDPSGYDEKGNPLERSDIVHDLLVYLAERMIELNKDKRETTERFWTDLEGVTDSETFKKLRRGKQEKTLANRSEACRPFVNPESGSAKHLDEGLAWSEEAFRDFVKLLGGRIPNLSDLVVVYRKYALNYKELVDRIEATDKLIDQIVYRLYGLTDEEIRIVEEATK